MLFLIQWKSFFNTCMRKMILVQIIIFVQHTCVCQISHQANHHFDFTIQNDDSIHKSISIEIIKHIQYECVRMNSMADTNYFYYTSMASTKLYKYISRLHMKRLFPFDRQINKDPKNRVIVFYFICSCKNTTL